jgi:hypothetical protein
MTGVQPPWWYQRRFRLPLLLGCLGLTLSALIATGSLQSAGSAPSRRACVPTPPPLPSVRLSTLVELHASLLGVMKPLARARYSWGTVLPEDAWSDNYPRSLAASRQAGRLWPASWEMRSWTSDPQLASAQDDVVADVFLFAEERQARRFFAEATSDHCRSDGPARPASEPPRARNLVWVNPDHAIQDDVFLLRGLRVYRVGEVRPPGAPSRPSVAQQQAGVSRVDALACALPDADCPRPAI